MRHLLSVSLLLLWTCTILAQAQKTPETTELWEPVPPVVTPGVGTAAPSDALVLFNGNDLDEWINQQGEPAEWVVAEGCLTVKAGTGMIKTKRKFGDCQLHIEWRSPAEVKGDGQGRGNSGIFLQEYLDQGVVKDAGRKPNLQYGELWKNQVFSAKYFFCISTTCFLNSGKLLHSSLLHVTRSLHSTQAS